MSKKEKKSEEKTLKKAVRAPKVSVTKVVDKANANSTKGSWRRGGRSKGTPNKNSVVYREALDDAGFNLVLETLEAALEIHNPSERFAALLSIHKFVYPRLKELDVSLDVANTNSDSLLNLDNIPDEYKITLMKNANAKP